MSDNLIVHIIDSDDAKREPLVSLLDGAGYELRSYASASEFLAHVPEIDEGCIVCDARMDGLTLCGKLREKRCYLPMVLVTAHADVTLAVAAMKAGANDFLEEPFDASALLHAIQASSSCRFGRRASDSGADEARRRLGALTEREQEVLTYLVAGESNKMVAAKLGVSPRTVEFHRAHILDKTRAHGLPELVRLWLASEPANGSGTSTPRAFTANTRSQALQNQITVRPSRRPQ